MVILEKTMGAAAVLVVDPQNETASLHRPLREVEILTRNDIITLPDLLPEFSLPVDQIFK